MVKNIWSKIAYYWFIAMLIICGFLFGNKLKASTSIGIYAGYNGYTGSCSENGYFNYDKLGPNVQGEIYWSKGAINTAISGKAKNISIAFKYDLSANKTYDVTITFYGSDLTNYLKVSNFQVYKTLGCGDGRDYNDSTLSLVSFTNKATSSSNTNKLKFRISTLAVIGDWEIQLRGGNNTITSVSNFGIKSVVIDEVDTSGNNQVIENNNNNTNSIINNQNQNTQDIINNQNELLGSKCPNLIDFNGGNVYTITATSDDYYKVTDYYVHLEANKTYYFKWNSNKEWGNTSGSDSVEVFFLKDKGYTNLLYYRGKEQTLTPTVTGDYYLRLDCNKNGQTCTYYNFMISEENKPYCKFGSFTSKQDETTNSINNMNDTLKDDSIENPSSFIEDMEDLLPENGVITQLITLPLSLFNKVLDSLNGTCQSFNLGSLYGTNLVMGCVNLQSYLGSTLWNLIDLIISGMFVYFMAKKFIKVFQHFTSMKEGDILDD